MFDGLAPRCCRMAAASAADLPPRRRSAQLIPTRRPRRRQRRRFTSASTITRLPLDAAAISAVRLTVVAGADVGLGGDESGCRLVVAADAGHHRAR